MDTEKVIPGKDPRIKGEQARLDEALRLYKVIDSITAKGCDAEVKRISRRSTPTDS